MWIAPVLLGGASSTAHGSDVLELEGVEFKLVGRLIRVGLEYVEFRTDQDVLRTLNRDEVIRVYRDDAPSPVAGASDDVAQGATRVKGSILCYSPEAGIVIYKRKNNRIDLGVFPEKALFRHIQLVTPAPSLDEDLAEDLTDKTLKTLDRLVRKKRHTRALALADEVIRVLRAGPRAERVAAARERTLKAMTHQLRHDFSIGDVYLSTSTSQGREGRRITNENLTFTLMARKKEFEGLVMRIWARTEQGIVYHSRFTYYTYRALKEHRDTVSTSPGSVEKEGRVVHYHMEIEHSGVKVDHADGGPKKAEADWWSEAQVRGFHYWTADETPNASRTSSGSLCKEEVDGPPPEKNR